MKLTLGPKAWAQWHPGSVAELLPWYVRLGILSSCGLYEIVVGSRGLVLWSHSSTMVPTETLRINTILFSSKKCWQPWAYVTTTHCKMKMTKASVEDLQSTLEQRARVLTSPHSAPEPGVVGFRQGWLVRVGWNPCFRLQTWTGEDGRNTGQFIWDIHTFFYINCFVEFCPSILAHKGDETLKTEGGEIYVGSFLGEWHKDERLFLLEGFVWVLTSVWRQFELATLFERETCFFSERNMHGTWFKIISRRSLDLQWSTVYDRQICSFFLLVPQQQNGCLVSANTVLSDEFRAISGEVPGQGSSSFPEKVPDAVHE